MKILFLCKHNRFRSKVAEAIFNFYNKNKKIKVRSRGIIKDVPSAKTTIEVIKERGVKLRDRISRKVSKKDIKWADLIILVANNVSRLLFKGKKVLVWKIPDTSANNIPEIKNIIYEIDKKVKKLVVSLNKKV